MQAFILPAKGRDPMLSRITAFLRSLPERSYRLELREHRSTRSIQQCRYLNAVAYKLLSNATGYERDDISEFLCGTYFGWREKKVPRKPGITDGIASVPVRTTTMNEDGQRDVLSWADFWDYVAFVQRFGAEHGVHIPDPDPNWRDAA